MSLGPFDLTGGPFLALYAGCFLVTVAAGLVIPRWLKPEGRPQVVTDPDDLAWLAGGRQRFTETVVTRLLERGSLLLGAFSRFHVQSRDAGRSQAERDILSLRAPIAWRDIERAGKETAGAAGRKLAGMGLAMDDSLVTQMRFWQTSPYFLLLAFGATKWMVGSARDKPVGFLTLFLILTAICAAVRWARVDRATRGGKEALTRARERSERLRRAPASGEADTAVALFGTSVLVGSSLSEFHQLRTPSSNDGGSSGDSGGDGGCGGCGGCGG